MSRRSVNRFSHCLVLLALAIGLAGAACQGDAGYQLYRVLVLADLSSDVPRLAGVWDVFVVDDEAHRVARLICDETGDPRQLQGFGSSLFAPAAGLEEAASGNCEVIHGAVSPAWCLSLDGRLHSLANGSAYAARAISGLEDGTLRVEVLINSQDANGALGTATLKIEAAFAADLFEAETLAQVEGLLGYVSGILTDAAQGSLTIAGLEESNDGVTVGVVAVRSLYY